MKEVHDGWLWILCMHIQGSTKYNTEHITCTRGRGTSFCCYTLCFHNTGQEPQEGSTLSQSTPSCKLVSLLSRHVLQDNGTYTCVCACVCTSVCYYSSCDTIHFYTQTKKLWYSVVKYVDFHKDALFANYSVTGICLQ